MSSVKKVQSVRNACRVLEAIASAQPVGVSELARVTGIDKSAVHRLAVTLHAAGWLDRRDERRWCIAPSLSALVTDSARSSLIHEVRPLLERARSVTGETAMVVEPDGTRLRILAVAESQQNLRVTATAGVDMPARNSSALRALAPHFGARDLDAWRSVDLALTDEALTAVRVRGWSANDAELIPESRGVAAALLRPDGSPLAALVLCGPSSRFLPDHVVVYGRLVASLADEWHALVAQSSVQIQ